MNITTHNVHYQLNIDDQKKMKNIISPIHLHDHIFTWLTSFFYLFLLYLLYRGSHIFLIGGGYILQYDHLFNSYEPLLHITSASLNNLTVIVLILIQIALAVFLMYRLFFFYYHHFISGTGIMFSGKNTKKDYVINSSVDNSMLSFTYTVKDSRKLSMELSFTEQDILKAIPYKSGYLFICSLYPLFLYNLKKRKLNKSVLLQNALVKLTYFLMVNFAKVRGILVYFPIPDSFNSKEKEQFSFHISQTNKT